MVGGLGARRSLNFCRPAGLGFFRHFLDWMKHEELDRNSDHGLSIEKRAYLYRPLSMKGRGASIDTARGIKIDAK